MNFIYNAWYVALWAQDLNAGQLVSRTVLGEPLVFFRNEQGETRALQDVCPHRFAPLHMGSIKPGGNVQCGYHGLQFNELGECVHNPQGDGRIPAGCRLRAFPAVEKHSIVWVWMGSADPRTELIPDYSFLDGGSGQLESKRDYLSMEASYRLVIDNLLDLSHVPFLHDGLLGNSTTIKAEVKIEQIGQSIHVSRDKAADFAVPGPQSRRSSNTLTVTAGFRPLQERPWVTGFWCSTAPTVPTGWVCGWLTMWLRDFGRGGPMRN